MCIQCCIQCTIIHQYYKLNFYTYPSNDNYVYLHVNADMGNF